MLASPEAGSETFLVSSTIETGKGIGPAAWRKEGKRMMTRNKENKRGTYMIRFDSCKFFPVSLLLLLTSFCLLSLGSLPCFGQEGDANLQVQSGDDYIANGSFRILTDEEKALNRVVPGKRPSSSSRGLVVITIPTTYTGTAWDEQIEYQIPSSYDPGTPAPMLVCWHRYSQSCASVSLQSLLDEECESRGWIYLAITGATSDNFGFLGAQINCTQAISYMSDPVDGLGLNVDSDRIYMTGCSMGGGAAISYVSRHQSSQAGHRIAGLILVASPVDWTHAAISGDTGALASLTNYLGGDPYQCPFKWKQISGLTIVSGSADLDQSMAQNLLHGCPIYTVYASNDPLPYLTGQMQALTFMLSNIGADYVMQYEPMAAIPHNWDLLNYTQALNFIGSHSLLDQETESLNVLMDQEEKFYWVEMIEQTVTKAFSRFTGSADSTLNQLDVTETVNMNTLRVDCDWAGLDDTANLMVDYTSTSAVEQEIQFEPLATEPTYVVDAGGVLHPEYSYDSGNDRSLITREAGGDLDLKLSFEPYNLTLTAAGSVPIGSYLYLNLSGGQPADTAVFFLALTQMEFAIGYSHILVPPIPPSIFLVFPLDGTGSAPLNGQVPNDPGLVGLIFYMQFITYDKILYEVKEVSNLCMTEIL